MCVPKAQYDDRMSQLTRAVTHDIYCRLSTLSLYVIEDNLQIIPKRAANCVVAFGVIDNHSLSRVIV